MIQGQSKEAIDSFYNSVMDRYYYNPKRQDNKYYPTPLFDYSLSEETSAERQYSKLSMFYQKQLAELFSHLLYQIEERNIICDVSHGKAIYIYFRKARLRFIDEKSFFRIHKAPWYIPTGNNPDNRDTDVFIIMAKKSKTIEEEIVKANKLFSSTTSSVTLILVEDFVRSWFNPEIWKMLSDCFSEIDYYCSPREDSLLSTINAAPSHYQTNDVLNTLVETESVIYIVSGHLGCITMGHRIKGMFAQVRDEKTHGTVTIPIQKCIKCQHYFILKEVLELQEKHYGKLWFNGEEGDPSLSFDETGWLIESDLHKFGYNVSAKDKLPTLVRQSILSSAISSGHVTQQQAMDQIAMLVRLNKNKYQMLSAVEKWQEDLDWLSQQNILKKTIHGHLEKYSKRK